LLTARGAAYRYRDYRTDPLSQAELRNLLRKLGLPARDVLRRNDPAYKALGLDGTEPDTTLVPLLAEHPTLLARPIGVLGSRAIVGRPPERLLQLLESPPSP
jgi:arsenate reductase